MPIGIYPKEKRKNLFQKGHKQLNTGKTRFKKGQTRRENNVNWNNGSSFEPYPRDWTDDLRESIRKRDNYTCQICGTYQDELKGWHRKLDIHHKDYNKDNLNPNNLITLCKSCHTKTSFDRNYWINYFS